MPKSFTPFSFQKLLQLILVITFLFLNKSVSFAQFNDSIRKDTLHSLNLNATKPVAIKHSPRKAALMSAACPGLGQIYNKKYWKLPIIYVGFGALAYSITFNQTKYKKYLFDLKDSYDNTYTGVYSKDQLNTLQHYYHRYRDLSVIGAAALYLLNIVDANVDAHLFTFDVSEDLSFRLHPTLINSAHVNHCAAGLSLTIKL